MEQAQKQLDKTMQAENAAMLKYLIDLELSNMKKAATPDMMLMVGVDGRIFSSLIPTTLNSMQLHLLNMLKGNLPSICAQLRAEKLQLSFAQYDNGAMIITGINAYTFLASLYARKVEISELAALAEPLSKGSVILRYIFEQRSMSVEALAGYPADVAESLKALTRQLFVETFDQSKGYKKNESIYKYLKTKVAEVVGIGSVEEVLSVTLNELGASMAYMKDDQWVALIDKIVDKHVRTVSGDMMAQQCKKEWTAEVGKRLKSFV